MFKVNPKWIDEIKLPKVNNKDTRTTSTDIENNLNIGNSFLRFPCALTFSLAFPLFLFPFSFSNLAKLNLLKVIWGKMKIEKSNIIPKTWKMTLLYFEIIMIYLGFDWCPLLLLIIHIFSYFWINSNEARLPGSNPTYKMKYCLISTQLKVFTVRAQF